MASQKYEPLGQRASDTSSDDQLDLDSTFPLSSKQVHQGRAWKLVCALLALLGVSIASNVLLVTKLRVKTIKTPRLEAAPSITGLKWDVSLSNANGAISLEDPLWDDPDLEEHVGYVALDHEMAKAKGVEPTQNWPWDHSKGIYILQAWHSVHCVIALRGSLQAFRDNKEQLYSLGHLSHCLHLLLNDATCKADDMPLFTGHHTMEGNTTKFFPPGDGQVRVCRDFKKLVEYAKQNSACYFRPRDYYIPIAERYKHCPDGSTPWLDKDKRDVHK